MPVVVTIREDSTDYLEFQLLSASVGIDLSDPAVVVELVTKDKDLLVATYATNDADPQLIISDPPNGKVKFWPKIGNFNFWKSPYKCYFWVISSATVKGAVPEHEEFTIKVREQYM